MIGITKSNISSGRCLVSFKRKSNINSNVITTRWIVNSFLGEAYDGTFQNNASSGSNSLVPQNGENAPRFRNALILPISRRPVFPSFMSAFNIKNEKIANAIINDKSVSQGYVGLFLRKDSNENVEHNELITKFDQIYRVGTYAQVQSAVRTDFGTQLLLIAHRRVSLDRITSFGPPAYGDIIHWNATETINETPKVRALMNELMQVARELIQLNPLLHEHINQMLSRIQISNPNRLADFAASLCSVASGEELQKVLETASTEERLHLALDLLSKEREMARLQKEIQRQVEEKMSKQQREYLLKEQLKNIKQELGIEKDDKDELLTKYYEKIENFRQRKISKVILKTIEDEMKKLEMLEKNSPEFNVTRSYLDWLVSLPFGLASKDLLNIKQAKEILDHDHYGLDEIKKRILEFIAVGKLKKTINGKIICFVGPPGVGKTSIAKSIARALDRTFYRFSVGGLTDMAEIKGHRRTYIGAMPGKPIQALKSTGYINPLILIDEIDKLGRGYQGDPASALLELLDPNQNESFVDHYLDVPVDFSNVLFVCTANDESTIPGPLRDRMEMIRLSGYDIPEKVAIATRYLVPKAIKESGLNDIENFSFTVTEKALEALVKNYCRESGVRSLEKHIEKLARKVAFEAVEKVELSNPDTVTNETVTDAEVVEVIMEIGSHKIVNTETADDHKQNDSSSPKIILPEPLNIVVEDVDLEKYLGKAKFAQDTIYENHGHPLPVGIVMGLAWNPLGGSPIFIETAAIPTALSEGASGVNVVTGQLGSVMKESVSIAYTHARQFVVKRDATNVFFKTHQLHLHVPEGAIEKDGPSAGVAMTSSFISIATNTPLRPRVAMTGELSLTGKVLPVGGIKEKILAALRSGADTVILPHANRRDYDELPDYVKDNVKIHFVKTYDEVYEVAFESN